ncbi:CPBP family glutamic-type intramembrane protease [Anaerococcus sp. AGMB09787]|uniref:CPBP family glutamic-type intramembrane protease n=1 Tax=Anaerococcus sp. AGMB09787 TaxID=2922869 RepID=UPI001FAFCAD0|nr:CPBP family glutamic-type intramembrane protease [Anaerococcus sp. AGMB09787]
MKIGIKTSMIYTLFSAIVFSLLHSVNILGGLPINQVLSQFITTLSSGLYYVVVYMAAKNIALPIIFHGLWDYISLSEITKTYPIVNWIIIFPVLAQLIASLVVIFSHRKYFMDK